MPLFRRAFAPRLNDCAEINDENNAFNRVFVAPNGMDVFFAGGALVQGYRTHTSIPLTPSPTTPAPTTPAPTTPSPTTPAPTTPAPTTPAPTTSAPTTPAPTTSAPTTPAPTTPAPTTGVVVTSLLYSFEGDRWNLFSRFFQPNLALLL